MKYYFHSIASELDLKRSVKRGYFDRRPENYCEWTSNIEIYYICMYINTYVSICANILHDEMILSITKYATNTAGTISKYPINFAERILHLYIHYLLYS